ncbi:hypothetical protein ABQF26_39705, partial [Mycolicibacterium elephantis]
AIVVRSCRQDHLATSHVTCPTPGNIPVGERVSPRIETPARQNPAVDFVGAPQSSEGQIFQFDGRCSVFKFPMADNAGAVSAPSGG